MGLITERYADKIAGVLSCFDRVIVTGNAADVLLRRGNDQVPVGAAHPDFRFCRLSPRR